MSSTEKQLNNIKLYIKDLRKRLDAELVAVEAQLELLGKKED